PSVTIAPPTGGGTQATATAQITLTSSGQVTGASVTSPGSNYSSVPTVTLIGGGGTGATAEATIMPLGSPVSSVSLTGAGTGCYASAPTVSFAGGGYTVAASATAMLDTTQTCIYAWSATGSCSSYKGTTQNVGANGGSSFVGTITFKNGN